MDKLKYEEVRSVEKLKTTEILLKAEELQVNLSKLTEYELNRIAGYVEGLISAKDLKKESA